MNIKEKQTKALDQAIKNLKRLFPDSTTNNNSLILISKTNLIVPLNDVLTISDLNYSIISNCSFHACKLSPYGVRCCDESYQEYCRNNFNTFLNTKFNKDEWSLIYKYFSNG